MPTGRVIVWAKSDYYATDSESSFGDLSDNWALVDFDRSEFFSFFITPDGFMKFSSSHADGTTFKDTGESGESMTCGATCNLEDPHFHMVAITFGCTEGHCLSGETLDGVKKLYRNGALSTTDDNPNGATGLAQYWAAIGRPVPAINNNCGTYNTACRRYGILGDGSEANTYDGSRNNKYFTGEVGFYGMWMHEMTETEIQDVYDTTKKYFQTCAAGYFCVYGQTYDCPSGHFCSGDWLVRVCTHPGLSPRFF